MHRHSIWYSKCIGYLILNTMFKILYALKHSLKKCHISNFFKYAHLRNLIRTRTTLIIYNVIKMNNICKLYKRVKIITVHSNIRPPP